MPQIADSCSITLVSNPGRRRAGLVPLSAALALGWAFSIAWLTVAVFAMAENLAWSVLIILTTIAFTFFLTLMSVSLVRDSYREYRVEISASEIVLTVIDKYAKRTTTQMILFSDVSYVEFYPYPDSACLIFHTPYLQLDVPLWPFGARGRDIVDYLNGLGVKVMDVQFDDQVPS